MEKIQISNNIQNDIQKVLDNLKTLNLEDLIKSLPKEIGGDFLEIWWNGDWWKAGYQCHEYGEIEEQSETVKGAVVNLAKRLIKN